MKRPFNEELLKHIHELLKMDEPSLITFLEKQYSLQGPQYHSDDLSASLSNLLYSLGLDFWRKDNQASLPLYPQIYADSLLADYFFDLQEVLCANGWLCATLDSEELTLEDKIDRIVGVLLDQVHKKHRWKYRFDPFAVVVLIIKIGGRRMCGCSDE
jgi:hypothetical protein